MTKEEKDLLIKDLCGRLPYNVALNCTEDDDEKTNFNCLLSPDIFKDLMSSNPNWIYKPYLRPLESMTKDEREEVQVFICDEWFFEDSGFATKVRKEGYIEFLANYDCSGIDPEFCGEYVDWLNAHYFDYRIVPSTGKSMIESGLALVAPEGMYKI